MYKESIGKDGSRHLGFQAPNPMTMTEFERKLVREEREERAAVRTKQSIGIQGVDGGRFEHQQC